MGPLLAPRMKHIFFITFLVTISLSSIMVPHVSHVVVVLLVVWICAICAYTLPKYYFLQRSISSSFGPKKNALQMVIEKRAKADELPITLSGKPLAVQALKLYKDLNVPPDREKWTVPQKFVIPHGNFSWPKDMWGMKLGKTAGNIRLGKLHKNHKTMLEFFGLDFSIRNTWDKTYTALKRYKDLNVPVAEQDHWTIPQKFVVPPGNASWPQSMWGMKLGTVVMSIRMGLTHKSHRKELEGLGLDFTVHRQHSDWDQTYTAFTLYKDLYVSPGNQSKWSIPHSFVVPHNTVSWPEAMWGMKLGRIRMGVTFKSHRKELESLGLDYSVRNQKRKASDSSDPSWRRVSATCLGEAGDEDGSDGMEKKSVFYTTFGSALGYPMISPPLPVPQPPSLSQSQQPHLQPPKQPQRQPPPPQQQRIKHRWDKTYAALKRYKDLHVCPDRQQDHWTIAARFVVPHNTASWPEPMWGMKLGMTASSIRQGKSYKNHRAQLESLGFDFTVKKHQRGHGL